MNFFIYKASTSDAPKSTKTILTRNDTKLLNDYEPIRSNSSIIQFQFEKSLKNLQKH